MVELLLLRQEFSAQERTGAGTLNFYISGNLRKNVRAQIRIRMLVVAPHAMALDPFITVRLRKSVKTEMRMRVLVLAAQKGGSNKTTLALNLAVEAMRQGDGPVTLIDTDPQASLTKWWNRRAENEL